MEWSTKEIIISFKIILNQILWTLQLPNATYSVKPREKSNCYVVNLEIVLKDGEKSPIIRIQETKYEAQQDTAKRAVELLKDVYGLTIVDVNYQDMQKKSVAYKSEIHK